MPKSCLQLVNSKDYDKELEVIDEEDGDELLEGAPLGPEPAPPDGERDQPEGDVDSDQEDEDDMNLAELFRGLEGEGDLPKDAVVEREEGHEEEKAERSGDLDAKIDELSKPPEMVTIYLSRPMRRRTGQAALVAIQALRPPAQTGWNAGGEPAQ